ncbi:MAG: hypothetical protein DRH26_00740 [Deltaproteobacteria bacterium]|nr:MAG: hypothetical protein DRH26_00740 [Deltaproteobacteria bacterium]
MKSVLHLKEEVGNKDRKFGSLLSYYPVMIQNQEGHETPALFTQAQIEEAQERAARNPEDIPEESFWGSIFG